MQIQLHRVNRTHLVKETGLENPICSTLQIGKTAFGMDKEKGGKMWENILEKYVNSLRGPYLCDLRKKNLWALDTIDWNRCLKWRAGLFYGPSWQTVWSCSKKWLEKKQVVCEAWSSHLFILCTICRVGILERSQNRLECLCSNKIG